MALVTSKTSALRSLLMRAWRERWSDIQWGIHLKSVLPRGCSGDAYNLSNLILQQALVGPVPNELILSYLRHSLAAQTVSYAALLEAISTFGSDGSPLPVNSDQDLNATPRRVLNRPHCVAALLAFVESSYSCMTSRGKPEECVSLASSSLKVTLWLLKCMQSVMEMGEKVSEVETKNFSVSLNLVKKYLDSEFITCLLYIGKAEDKETHDKILSTVQHIYEFTKNGAIYLPEVELKHDIAKIVTSLNNLDPLRLLPDISSLPSFVHAIQPMLLCEGLLRPASDLSTLAFHLQAVAIMHNISFAELIFEVLRCLLLTISQKEGFESLKVDSFILVSLPSLLEKLYKLMKTEPGSSSGMSGHQTPLKTPTDLYKVFDKILTCDALLNSVDLRCRCNIIEILLRVIRKCPTQLLTDTENDDVLKKREKQISESRMMTSSSMEEIIGNIRQFDLTLKAENTLDSVLKTLEVDCYKPEAMENLLGVLSHVIQGDSFNLLLAASSANGKLRHFIKRIIKCNQQSQESQGESVKNSLLRAALFDISFLMLVHVVQCFGSEVVLSEAHGTFIETWISDMMVESDCRVKSFHVININDNIVDNLLQQLGNGDLRTQVVKWQNVCVNIHQAVKEMVIARSLNHLKEEDYRKMCSTLCSKLCSLPVCVVNFLASWCSSLPASGPINLKQVVHEFMEIVEKVAEDKQEQHSNGQLVAPTDLPYIKERLAMMSIILQRIQSQTGLIMKKTPRPGDDEISYDPKTTALLSVKETHRSLKEALIDTWHSIGQRGCLTIESMWKLHSLLKTGGPNWFTSCLVEELLSVVYQTDIDKLTELLLAIFYIDIEQCTLALLLHVIPGYLQYRNKRDRLTDPHGTALAKLTVGCIYIVLMGVHTHSSKHVATSHNSVTQRKRRADEMSDEIPSAKMRRLVGLSNENAPSSGSTSTTTFASSYDDYVSGLTTTPHPRHSPSESAGKLDELSSHPVTQAVAGFFRLLHNVVSCQEISITPCTHFAFRFLEQAALRGGHHQNAKSRLIFQHMRTSLVIHLVKMVPHLFRMGILSKLFDISNLAGRKNMARVMCLLKNLLASKRNRDVGPDPGSDGFVLTHQG